MSQGKKKKVTGLIVSVLSLLIAFCLFITLSSAKLLPFEMPTWNELISNDSSEKVISGSDTVHFVDCWQGDCEVIVSNKVVTVIDTGPSKYSREVVMYLKSLNVSKVDNLILTHTHEDHIGGAQKLIETFDVGQIYMKKPTEGTEATSAVYLDLLTAISDKGLQVNATNVGDVINAGNFTLTILGPLKDYNDENDQSIILRAQYNEVSFLFTGDAGFECENDMLYKYSYELDCDVLKVGHHGSKASSSKDFIAAVSPKYAVISCGENNEYSHPSGQTLSRLIKADAEVYRTDLNGNVVFSTDGKDITVLAEKTLK